MDSLRLGGVYRVAYKRVVSGVKRLACSDCSGGCHIEPIDLDSITKSWTEAQRLSSNERLDRLLAVVEIAHGEAPFKAAA